MHNLNRSMKNIKTMKKRILTISVTAIMTTVVILTIEYFLFGLNNKPNQSVSFDSPDGIYKAYVVENPSLDPPNQSLFISKNGYDDFRLVEDLPEDIENIQQIYWSPDSKTVVFLTNWHLIITDVDKFNSKKISINPDWWRWHKNKGTFSSSNKTIEIKEMQFINSDTLKYRTSEMAQAERICINNL